MARMKQTLADLAIRLGLPGFGLKRGERKSFGAVSQQQLFIADRTKLGRVNRRRAGNDAFLLSVCLLQNRQSAGDVYRI